MSNKREREKRREERLQQEARVDSGERRTKLLQMAAGAVFLAIVAVVILIVVNSGSEGGDAENLQGAGEIDALVAGAPQTGMTLGKPSAKVELIEYGDLQCPACKAYAEEILPPVIENKVDSGEAKITFHNFTIIGPQSAPAGAAALAAGEQGRGWNFIELFYRNQGIENSGYADDEFLKAVAEGAGVKDVAKWETARKGAQVTGEVRKSTEEAQRLGFESTPSFAIKGPKTNGLKLLGNPGSSEEIEAAIDDAG